MGSVTPFANKCPTTTWVEPMNRARPRGYLFPAARSLICWFSLDSARVSSITFSAGPITTAATTGAGAAAATTGAALLISLASEMGFTGSLFSASDFASDFSVALLLDRKSCGASTSANSSSFLEAAREAALDKPREGDASRSLGTSLLWVLVLFSVLERFTSSLISRAKSGAASPSEQAGLPGWLLPFSEGSLASDLKRAMLRFSSVTTFGASFCLGLAGCVLAHRNWATPMNTASKVVPTGSDHSMPCTHHKRLRRPLPLKQGSSTTSASMAPAASQEVMFTGSSQSPVVSP
mmetsp:Transcript_105458/g.251178  ORF Transcript_105458/g.251178 Transcript_105458/m.251178 type:complete len:294 (-) Transcript_105458:2702-3583(-)